MTRLTTSALRENIYRVLDKVIRTGTPVEIERKGILLTINPPEKKNKLSQLKKRKGLHGNPESIIKTGLGKTWKPYL